MKGTNIILIALMIDVIIFLCAGLASPSSSGPIEAINAFSAISFDTGSMSNTLKGDSSDWFMIFVGSAVAPFEMTFNFLLIITLFVSWYLGFLIPDPNIGNVAQTQIGSLIGASITLFLAVINFSLVKELYLLYKGARD